MKKNSFITIGILTLLLLLLLFPESTFIGSKNGLLLWFNIILPTLLPFVIVSNLIIKLHITNYISFILYPFFHKLFLISKEGCYPIIIGMISGFPIGAKACADLVKSNCISLSEGQFILSFCNNASPMFVTSFIALQCLNAPKWKYILLGILMIAPFITAFLYRLHESFFLAQHIRPTINCRNRNLNLLVQNKNQSKFEILDDSIFDGFEVLTKIGGYIILLSLLAQIIYDTSFLPSTVNSFIVGLLEITTGCNALASTTLSFEKKTILITIITAFGGLSSLAQTQSVISNSGLSIKKYFFCKILNAMIATILIILILNH
jgi:sporulation integral membrane protein YlbJ